MQCIEMCYRLSEEGICRQYELTRCHEGAFAILGQGVHMSLDLSDLTAPTPQAVDDVDRNAGYSTIYCVSISS